MTHKELTQRARGWLAGRRRCRVIITEMGCQSVGEIPDAMGWCTEGSVLIECKTSRADFLKDRKKPWRDILSDYAMGELRYYMVPPNIVDPGEVPEGWGLLVVLEKQIRIKKLSERFTLSPGGWDNERRMLISLCWRVAEAAKLLKPISILDLNKEVTRCPVKMNQSK